MAEQAEAEFHHTTHARVDEPVVDPVAIAPSGNDSLVGHSLKMVRHALRARTDLFRDRISLTVVLGPVIELPLLVIMVRVLNQRRCAAPRHE